MRLLNFNIMSQTLDLKIKIENNHTPDSAAVPWFNSIWIPSRYTQATCSCNHKAQSSHGPADPNTKLRFLHRLSSAAGAADRNSFQYDSFGLESLL